MEVVKLAGSPPSRRVRPQSSNARSLCGSGQSKTMNSAKTQQLKTSTVVQIPSVYEQSHRQSPKNVCIFSAKSGHRSFSPTHGGRTGAGSPGFPGNRTRSFSPNRFSGPAGTRPGTSSPDRDFLSMRPGSSASVRPTSPAEQRQTINELISKTNFLLEVLDAPESNDDQSRRMTRSRTRALVHHIETCERELQEAEHVMHPVARIPKSRPKSALTISLSTLTAKDMIKIERYPADRRALYSPTSHWNTAYKDTFMPMADRQQKMRVNAHSRKI